MSESFRHVTRYSFGSEVYHRVTGDKGVVFGILLHENCAARYICIFEDSRAETECLEAELQDEPKTTTTAS